MVALKAVDIAESVWSRSEFASIWRGPDLELVVVSPGGCESWRWTCIGWRTPSNEEDGSCWMWSASRETAEREAMQFYLEKD